MASRSRLYTRFRTPHADESQNRIRKINVITLDIDMNHLTMNDSQLEVKVFTIDEADECVDYITSKTTNVSLFITNVIGNILIPLIYECLQVTSIYILCKDEQYQNYSNAEPKIRGIFKDLETMFNQFQRDITEPQNKYFSEESTFQNINPESAEFLWWRFLDKILLHIRHTNIAKQEFTAFCREYCPENEHIVRDIKEFETNYTSDKAIYWYTRESFLYQLLNRTLRTQKTLNNIFKLRLFLTDVVSGLKTSQSDLHDTIHYPIMLYRGVAMATEEIQQLKSAVGNSVLFNQFLSTTMNREVAQVFAENSINDPSRQSALFTFEIDSFNTNSNRTPFANISRYSAFEEEDEILFSMHSTFLVQSVQLIEDNKWHIDLKFMDNLWDIDFGERSIFNPHADQIFIRNLSKENKQFSGFQLLMDLILRLDQTKYAKDELLEFCRSKYKDDPIELKKIDNFENEYQSKDAAKWYTKDSFLYRLLNESLRIETIDYIVKMRYFIHDLHNQLAELQTDFIQSLDGADSLTLYRGQTMKMNQLDEIRENIGGLISMNSFISTTHDEDVAFKFSGDGVTTEPDEVSVIYEMLIDPNIRSTPYAKIRSVMQDEQEILFSMGSVFRIGEVDELRNRVYYVKLTMVHIEDQLWNKLTAHLYR